MPRPHTRSLIVGAFAALTFIAAAALFFAPRLPASGAFHARSYRAALENAHREIGRVSDHAAINPSAEDIFATRGEEADRNPDNNPAVEQAANRAYPLTQIPIAYTQAASAAFTRLSRSNRGNHTALNWYLLGPTYAIQPGVLSFNGTQYIASGRVTAMAIAPSCTPNHCRLWVGAAGGGVWRTDNALSGAPSWQFLSNGIASNAIGTLYLDPNDSSGNTIYAGTGEPNASADSEAGAGIFKSTDGGSTWAVLPGSVSATQTFFGRAISFIAAKPGSPNTLYVGVSRAIRGMSSVIGGATSNPPPPVAALGLYVSNDGGNSFTFLWNGNGTVRGVNQFALDPFNSSTMYAAAFQQGVWRSADSGATWSRIFAPQSPGAPSFTDRSEFAVTALPNGKTRMYLGDGAVGAAGGATTFSQLFRSDDVTAASPSFKALTDPVNGDPGYATFDYCEGQCWYDNVIATPAGNPDQVFVLGSYAYSEIGFRSNGRAVVRSTTAGEPDPANNNRTFTDLTWDAQTSPQEQHPDMHAIVFDPNNPNIIFMGSDGGVVRTDGTFVDVSSQCDSRPIGVASMATCHRLLSGVPGKLFNINKGLSTLQFQSVSINPLNPTGEIMGGTQDNGTWQYTGSSHTWYQTIYGDGGQSGFDSSKQGVMFNEFTGSATDSNFRDGLQTAWVVVSGPLANSGEPASFYSAILQDPVVSGTRFFGLAHVWRTLDNGGDQGYLETNCPEFTTAFNNPSCGDWAPIGSVALTDASLGTRPGGAVIAVARTGGDSSTLWSATTTGRVFVSHNANATPEASVSFTRLDSLSAAAPGRFVTGIYVDPANSNHAWISYSGYSAATPATPGHVFDVLYDPVAGAATWTNIDPTNGVSGGGDLPVTAIVRDDNTGDLYAATDFGVARLPAGTTTWGVPPGLPIVEVAGLSISSSGRRLYAATHGRSVWALALP